MPRISNPDNLIAGDFLLLVNGAVIAAGEELKRGTVLGKITDSGKYTIAKAAAGDGSEAPIAILGTDVAASEEDRQAEIYITGLFSANHVTLGEGITEEAAAEELHKRSIFLVRTI